MIKKTNQDNSKPNFDIPNFLKILVKKRLSFVEFELKEMREQQRKMQKKQALLAKKLWHLEHKNEQSGIVAGFVLDNGVSIQRGILI